MKKYIVYMHTSNTSGKKYIGYTKFSLSERMKKHYTNALAGQDTHFYNAIRKYGLDDFSSKILEECLTKEDATSKESYYIGVYNTYEMGYNQTKGGNGGWAVPEEKYDSWVDNLKLNSYKENNSRWCGYSDEEILSAMYEYMTNNPLGFSVKKFITYSSEKFGFPKSYSKNRFGGIGLLLAFEKAYGIKPEYKKTEDHKKKLCAHMTGKNWYSNDELKISRMLKEKDVTNNWVKGRKYGTKN